MSSISSDESTIVLLIRLNTALGILLLLLKSSTGFYAENLHVFGVLLKTTITTTTLNTHTHAKKQHTFILNPVLCFKSSKIHRSRNFNAKTLKIVTCVELIYISDPTRSLPPFKDIHSSTRDTISPCLTPAD